MRSTPWSKSEHFWQATGKTWHTNGWLRQSFQSLVFIFTLHFSQWGSLPFCLPSGPPEVFASSYILRMTVRLAYSENWIRVQTGSPTLGLLGFTEQLGVCMHVGFLFVCLFLCFLGILTDATQPLSFSALPYSAPGFMKLILFWTECMSHFDTTISCFVAVLTDQDLLPLTGSSLYAFVKNWNFRTEHLPRAKRLCMTLFVVS